LDLHLAADGKNSEPVEFLDGYFAIVGICGGISAYKVAAAVSDLVKKGCQVQVVMTRSGKKFVGPATFGALTGRSVLSSLWHRRDVRAIHVELTEAADVMVVAPATANIIGKVAGGIADDLLSTLIMTTDSPVVFVPAMNKRMWQNPIVQENVNYLQQKGYVFIGPTEGPLVCGEGIGRMVEPQQIVQQVAKILVDKKPKGLLSGQ